MNKTNKLIAFLGVGMEAVGLILCSVWIGEYLDQKFETKVVFTSIFPLLALGGWFIHVVFMVKKMNSPE